MNSSRKPENRPPWPEDFNAALDERDRVRPQPSLRSQVITTIKVFTAGGLIVLALWVIDLIVTD